MDRILNKQLNFTKGQPFYPISVGKVFGAKDKNKMHN